LLLESEKLIQHFQLLVYDALDEDSSPRTHDPFPPANAHIDKRRESDRS
jgi:hypothetical protein